MKNAVVVEPDLSAVRTRRPVPLRIPVFEFGAAMTNLRRYIYAKIDKFVKFVKHSGRSPRWVGVWFCCKFPRRHRIWWFVPFHAAAIIANCAAMDGFGL